MDEEVNTVYHVKGRIVKDDGKNKARKPSL